MNASHDRLDRELAEVDVPRLSASRARVATRLLRRVARRHRDAVHALRPERLRRRSRRSAPSRSRRRGRARRRGSRSSRRSRAGRARARAASARGRRASAAIGALRSARRSRAGADVDDRHLRGRVALALERAAAHVAQPPADRLVGLDVDDEQRLLEPGRAREHLALVVEHDGVPVEDELVLAADGVARRRRSTTLSRARVASICSRSRSLPTWNGEAEMLTSSCAPASARSVAGGPGCQMSSQTVGPISASPCSSRTRSRPGAK